MTPRRLFAEHLPPAGGQVRLGAEAARHARVLRLGPGDPLELFDGEGARASARIVTIEEAALVCEADPAEPAFEPGPAVHLLLGVPKSGALDDAVRAATEAGATSIHLVRCEHSVVRADSDRLERRVARLERIAREAARQSERGAVPAVYPLGTPEEVLSRVPAGAARVLCWARDAPALGALTGSEAWVAVGPEGGFSHSECILFEAEGFVRASLGPHVLRAVTAAPVAVAMVGDRLRRSIP